jgi:hypothetical protein
MTFEKANIGYFLLFILIGGILGSAFGTLLARVVPSLSLIKESLTGAIGFNIDIISFSVRLNLSAIIGVIIGIILFKKA